MSVWTANDNNFQLFITVSCFIVGKQLHVIDLTPFRLTATRLCFIVSFMAGFSGSVGLLISF